MTDWLVIYNCRGRVEIPCTTLVEAEAAAHASGGRIEYVGACPPGARLYRTRKAALHAGAGPALACSTHFHTTPLEAAA